MAWSLVTKIATDPTKCGSSDSTNFPMLFSGNYSPLATVANGGVVTNANGYDIGFYADAGLTTKLNWETESYANTGTVVYWVQIPTLSHSNPTNIWLAAGNSAVTTDQSNPRPGGSGWLGDSNYKGVWHLTDVTGGAGTVLDSTSNANNGTPNNSPTNATGQIGGGASFASASTQFVDFGSSINPTALTYSAWVKGTTFPNTYNAAIDRNSGSSANSVLYVKSTGKLAVFLVANASVNYDGTGSHTLSTGAWYYVAATYSSAAGLTGYVNGVSDNTVAANGNIVTTAVATQIGNDAAHAGENFNGVIDEARVSATVRSADWILAEYNNQSSPGSFYNFDQGFGVGDSGWNGSKHFIVGNGLGRSEWAN